MKMDYKGYIIAQSKGHGKSVKGTKETASIQVQDYNAVTVGFLILKHFSFKVNNKDREEKAIEKAKKFIDDLINSKNANINTLPQAP
jgi:hypothetical protein